MQNTLITHWLTIQSQHIKRDGKIIFQSDEKTYANFIKETYRHFKIGYPKFFKMDKLAKLGFLSAELLVRDLELPYAAEKIGVILQNGHTTLDTDTKHWESIADKENYFPSPAVFVYTLPNVMIGEICIRQGWKGENTCYQLPRFDARQLEQTVSALFAEEKIDCCLAGWVDQHAEEYSVYLVLVEKNKDISKDNSSFITQNLEQLFKL
ncbi:MAG: hypothetical protein R6U66_04305 [Bacteroidales bacterium]